MLERALLLSGSINECNFGNLQKLSWTRAARTDKGVHALCQCCSMRLVIPNQNLPACIDAINEFLPNDVRVFHISKVAKSFNAKISCSGRMYSYLLPTYMFAPESIGIAPAGANPKALVANCDLCKTTRDKLRHYRMPQEMRERLESVLQALVGTHKFHNFTYQKGPNDPSCQRYIRKFYASAPFLMNPDGSVISQATTTAAAAAAADDVEHDDSAGLEWVLVTVEGQSFLLNQIRKMLGIVIDIVRGVTPIETLSQAVSNQRVSFQRHCHHQHAHHYLYLSSSSLSV